MHEGKVPPGHHSSLSPIERRVRLTQLMPPRIGLPDFPQAVQQEPSAPITETPQGTAYEDEITEEVPR